MYGKMWVYVGVDLSSKLTYKQKTFCKEYIVDFNASRAARAARYSPKTAQVIGAQNLRKPMIQEELARLTRKIDERLERNAEELIRRMWEMNDIDASDYQEHRQTKTTELLAKHYSLLKDHIVVSLDDKTLNIILDTLPPEWAQVARQALLAYAKTLITAG